MSQFSLVTGFWENKRKYFTQILVLGDPWLAPQKGWKLKLYFGRSPLVWIRQIADTGGAPHMQKTLMRSPISAVLAYVRKVFWKLPMYVQVGDFYIRRGPLAVPLTQIFWNAVFFLKLQNPHNTGTLCAGFLFLFWV